MDFLSSLTICLAGFAIWIVSMAFVQSRLFLGILNIVSILTTGIGVWLLFQGKHYASGGLLLCLALFCIVYEIGLSFYWTQVKAEGPFKDFLGKEGRTITSLEPKGKIEIDGRTVPAISEGLFIAAREKVRIIRVSHRIVVVEKIE